MDRRAFARHRAGAALLLGLSLRAPSASAEPAEPAETRVGTVASKTAQELADGSLALPALPGDPLVLHRGSIDRVDLYLHASPAHFGHFAGGVVWAQTRGREPAPSGETRLRPFDVSGLIDAVLARGRGGLLPALLFLLSPEVKLDRQARATDEASARDRFSAFGFGSHDLRGANKHGILGRLGDACRPKITFTW